MRENLKSGSMRGGWRGGNSPDQSPTLLPLGPPNWPLLHNADPHNADWHYAVLRNGVP